MPVDYRQLKPNDLALMKSLLTMFGEVFNEVDTYSGNRPSDDYLRDLLGGESFMALIHFCSTGAPCIRSA